MAWTVMAIYEADYGCEQFCEEVYVMMGDENGQNYKGQHPAGIYTGVGSF